VTSLAPFSIKSTPTKTVPSIKPNSTNGCPVELLPPAAHQALNRRHTTWDMVDLVLHSLATVVDCTNHRWLWDLVLWVLRVLLVLLVLLVVLRM
jgi:hypothetical protein